jgi:F0F1-type ATP synthase assembly protein I
MSVVLGQVVVTVVAAIICLAVWGRTSGLSALVGGGISTVASVVMAALSFRRASLASPQGALRGLYVGEAAKLVTVVVLFVWVLRTLTVAPLAMFGAFMATLIIYWIALANALPSLGRRAA